MQKFYSNALLSFFFYNIAFLLTSKMMSPNSDISIIFLSEIGIEVIFKGNAVPGREKIYS